MKRIVWVASIKYSAYFQGLLINSNFDEITLANFGYGTLFLFDYYALINEQRRSMRIAHDHFAMYLRRSHTLISVRIWDGSGKL